MNDNEALAVARDILATGWVKGMLHADARGITTTIWAANRESSCMLGALSLVSQDMEQEVRLCTRVEQGIKKLVGSKCGIPGFNDDEDTTHEDVLLAMKYAEELTDE